MDEKIEQLMNDYGNDVLKIAYLYLKDKHLAEDAFQEVFVKVYKNYNKFKNNSSEKTWIMSITANTCRDILRLSWLKKVRFFKDIGDDSLKDTHENVDEEIARKMQYEKLLKEVMNLPLKYRELVILYYYEELSTMDISAALKIPEGTVRSRLFRARAILKSNLEGEIEYGR